MKTLPEKWMFRVISCMAILLLTFQSALAHHDVRISFQTFYDELAPYGTWIEDADYGYVWLPDVRADFQPYATAGHWIMTEYGNTWVSDYAWGWAPFHYGRWRYDDYYGWIWIPGTEWAPAWVAWRSGGGYYGWAPLAPGLNISVSINIGRYIPDYYWVFVRQGYICSPGIYSYCIPRRQVINIIHHTTVINNTYVYNNNNTYYTGPRVNEIERVTHSRVQVHRVQNMDRPGANVVRNGAVSVYRPAVANSRGQVYTPSHVQVRGGSSAYQHTRTDRFNTTRGQASSGYTDQRRSSGSERQRMDENSTAGRTRSYAGNSPGTNTAPSTRESAAGRSREGSSDSNSYRDNAAHSNREKNISSGTRESTSGRSNYRENSTNRSGRSASAVSNGSSRNGSSRNGDSRERGYSAPSSARTSQSSRQTARSRESHANAPRQSSGRGHN